MAHVALIGASGNVGSRILKELSDRGHTVTAIARHPEKIASLPNVVAKKCDLYDGEHLSTLLKTHDVIISSVGFSVSDPNILINAVRHSGVKRYIVVGGAGSLLVDSGEILFNQSDFPEAYKNEASKGMAFLDLLRSIDDLDWTFLSPSALFVPGERTGKFRVGKDHLLVSEKGSTISFEDYSIALVDELEHPKHIRERFTVGY